MLTRVDGNPLQDISILRNPERNFVIITKNGTIYKNNLH
jgi:hypothetical protein